MHPLSEGGKSQRLSETGFEPIGAMKYCPKCKSNLRTRSRVDIFTHGLICTNGHRFFVPIRRVSLDQQKGNMSYSSADDQEIAKAWLTKPELRSHLNDQLAEVLELFLDNEQNGKLTRPEDHAPNSYCFLCGEELTSSGTPDGWVMSYRCKKQHQLFERGGRLWTIVDDQIVELCNEMAPDFFHQVVEAFVVEDQLKRVTPHQIAELLSRTLGAKKPHEGAAK